MGLRKRCLKSSQTRSQLAKHRDLRQVTAPRHGRAGGIRSGPFIISSGLPAPEEAAWPAPAPPVERPARAPAIVDRVEPRFLSANRCWSRRSSSAGHHALLATMLVRYRRFRTSSSSSGATCGIASCSPSPGLFRWSARVVRLLLRYDAPTSASKAPSSSASSRLTPAPSSG